MERAISRANCTAAIGGVVALVMMLCAFALPASAYAENGGLSAADTGEGSATQPYEEYYKYNAERWNDNYPGVFTTKVDKNEAASADTAEKIGIWAIDDKNNLALATAPATESPAIITGSAVPWWDENATTKEGVATGKENARLFTNPSSERVAPYSYFKFGVGTVKNADGTDKLGPDGKSIPKLTGFDGSYYILRIDASNLFVDENGNAITKDSKNADQYYLHVQQAKNNALLVAIGQNGKTFSNLRAEGNNQVHYKVGSYNVKEMLDSLENDVDKNTPYFDVVLFSSSSIVAGADAQKEGALNGDVELSFYLDKQAQKDEPAEPYDPAKQFNTPEEQTAYTESYFKKYYDEEVAQMIGTVSRYKVMGSTFAIETMVDESDSAGAGRTFWSLRKSLQEYKDTSKECYYDNNGRQGDCGTEVKLICEVPVVTGLTLESADADSPRKRTLDVNSFDIQVANNASTGEGTYTSGLTLKNAWLEIDDSNNTTGAELAIGNNARMTIDVGGKLIVGEKCQLEIEWDGATTQPAAEGQPAATPDILNNGSLELKKDGELQNKGVITIEGTEGKPYQPGAGAEQAKESAKGHGEMTICEGATFTNEGCFMPNGALYIHGTFVNKGKYDDNPIVSNDPDKGKFTYHRGVQSTWKDDVTQSNVIYGGIYVGMDKNWEQVNKDAMLENEGDILLCPGEFVNMANVKNSAYGRILLCATDEATIPIEPDPNNPTVITKKVKFDTPKGSYLYNWSSFENEGEIKPAHVTVEETGSLGTLNVDPENKFKDCFALFLYDGSKIAGGGTVYKHDLSRAKVELRRRAVSYDSVVYNGYPWRFDVIAIMGDEVYTPSDAFKVSYQNASGKAITEDDVVNAGTYRFVLTGAETFTGTTVKTFTVKKAANAMTAKGKTAKVKAKKVKKKAQKVAAAKVVSVVKPQGKVTYKLTKIKAKKKLQKQAKKKIKMAANGQIKLKKGLKKGAYTLTVKVTAAGDANHTAVTKTVTCKVKVK